MTTGKAETVVATSAFVTFACVSGNAVTSGGLPSGRQVAATCLAFAALGAVAGVAPDIGSGLALATAGTAFALYGLPLLQKYFPDNQKGKTK